MQKITPFLWFDNNAEEAMNFYTSLFDNSEVKNIMRNGAGGPGPEGSILTASFTLHGQEFVVLNGGPQFRFNESVSFVINCESQEEVDKYWDALTADGGQESRCGWLKDKFGLSWQVVPTGMFRLLQSPEREKSARAMQAMMQMSKLDINVMQKAFDGA